jgi:FixJ family two-component response regulator
MASRVNLTMAMGSVVRQSPMVCVIDDDESIQRALRRLLGATGFRVETFSSAEEFLDSPHVRRADCLVLDVHLGKLSGLDLQERLAKSGAATPIVVVTAHDDRPTRDRAARAGAIEYLPKPFDDERLIAAIRKAIGDE